MKKSLFRRFQKRIFCLKNLDIDLLGLNLISSIEENQNIISNIDSGVNDVDFFSMLSKPADDQSQLNIFNTVGSVRWMFSLHIFGKIFLIFSSKPIYFYITLIALFFFCFLTLDFLFDAIWSNFFNHSFRMHNVESSISMQSNDVVQPQPIASIDLGNELQNNLKGMNCSTSTSFVPFLPNISTGQTFSTPLVLKCYLLYILVLIFFVSYCWIICLFGEEYDACFEQKKVSFWSNFLLNCFYYFLSFFMLCILIFNFQNFICYFLVILRIFTILDSCCIIGSI